MDGRWKVERLSSSRERDVKVHIFFLMEQEIIDNSFFEGGSLDDDDNGTMEVN